MNASPRIIHHPRPWALIAATGALFAASFVLLLALNLHRELNHDEHQFIASAALIARAGLTPYADFPYFHTPLLSYLYALIFSTFDSLLLSSRVVSVIFGWLALVVVFGIAWRRFAQIVLWSRWRATSLAALWLLALPVFAYTSGRAWNHDLPTLLLLLAFVAFSQALTPRRQTGWLLLSGGLIGLAAATRLSFALAGVVVFGAAWLAPAATLRQRAIHALTVAAGGLLATLLALAPALRDPAALWFGAVGYIQLNAQYYAAAAYGDAMTLAGKLGYFGDLLVATPTNVLVFTALGVALWPLRAGLKRGASVDPGWAPIRFRLLLLLALLLAMLPGAFGATPSQPQYFYPLFPLAILGVVEAFAAWPGRVQPGSLHAYVLGALTTLLAAVPLYAAGIAAFPAPGDWLPVRAHAYGELIGRLVGEEKVLTLAPIYALEGGAAIYPAFATGPFAWRVAPLLEETARARYGVIGPDELDDLLQATPPRAILTGVEDDDAKLEQPLVDYAQAHAFVPVPLPDKSTLWLAPQAQWDQAIQLGGHDLPTDPLVPGAAFVLTLQLQSLRPMTTNWSALIRVVDAAGSELLRDEGWPYGSPTSQWPVGEVWPDGHEFTVPPDAAPGYYRVDVSFYDSDTLEELGAPVSIGYLPVGDGAERVAAPPRAGFDDAIELLDAAVVQETRDGAPVLIVDTTWRAQHALDQEYTRFVHVLDVAGTLVAQQDGAPVGGFLPTRAWNSALPVRDRVEIPLPTNLPTGTYQVVTGFYDPATLARLPVTEGASATGDTFLVGPVQLP
jgi:hypothetical protein